MYFVSDHKNKSIWHQQNDRIHILPRKRTNYWLKSKKLKLKILKSKKPSIEPCGIPFTILF